MIAGLLVDLSGGLFVVFCTAAGLLAVFENPADTSCGQTATTSGDTLLGSEES